MGVRRRRRRDEEGRPRARRNIHDAVDRSSAARNADGDGVLAERQAVPPRLHAEHGADRRVRRALGRHDAAQGDARSAGTSVSLAYQPETMRWRGLTVLTNTPPKVSQRAPGGAQGIGIVEPILSKAAKKLGVDQVELRKINAPAGKAPFGPALPNGKQAYVTSAFVREALDKGRELFKWEEKKAADNGQKHGTTTRGLGVAIRPLA